MAERVTSSIVNTVHPGAYVKSTVKSDPVGVASSGIVVLIGEAEGGPASKLIDSANGVVLKDNVFGPDQFSLIKEIYRGGPIVDAFQALTAPSGDAKITGSASRIYIVKTNMGTKASAAVATAYGSVADKNWGKEGNKYNYQITHVIDEVPAEVTGVAVPAFGAALDGASFSLRLDGGTTQVITLGTGAGVHDDITQLVAELNTLLPTGISAQEGATAGTVKFVRDVDAQAHTKMFGKSFELIDSTAGDLAKLGHAEGLFISALEPEAQIDIKRDDIGLKETFYASAEVAFKIGYEGTDASMTIASGQLNTTVTGGVGAGLSIDLKDFATLKDLAEYINAQPGYTAEAISIHGQKSPLDLDEGALNICSTAAGLMPGRVKIGLFNFKKAMSQSTALDFTATASAGLPDETPSAIFLTGGTKGATTGANIVSALTDAETIDANFIVPLFSRDAADDIADGLTDSASTYTIDSIHAATKNHVINMSTVKTKKNRLALLSFWGSYTDAKTKAGTLASARCILFFQKVSQIDSQGVVQSYLPWYAAVNAAGMQSGGFYKSLTNKYANLITFEDPTGFDSGSFSQREDAIEAGLMLLRKDTQGILWTVDQTTYGRDTNFVYNSMQVMYASDLIALDLAKSFDARFVGEATSDVDASVALGFISTKMDQYRLQKLISASDDAPLGWKNAKVSINAPVMYVSVEAKVTSAIKFILIDLQFSQVKSQA